MARMLVCLKCETMWRMRDYEGPPEYDMELIDLIDRHLQRATDPRPESHPAQIMRVDEKSAKELDIESEVQKKMAEQGVFIREVRDDLKLDALKCYNKHSRPQGGCMDWENKSKAIGRTYGIPEQDRQYLCHLCPVASHVAFKQRQKAGAYDVQAHEKGLL